MAARLWRWFDALRDGVLSGSGDVGRRDPSHGTNHFWNYETGASGCWHARSRMTRPVT